MRDIRLGQRGLPRDTHIASSRLDTGALIALACAGLALLGAFLTENHMGMGLFMGVFIALICGSTLLLACSRVRRGGNRAQG